MLWQYSLLNRKDSCVNMIKDKNKIRISFLIPVYNQPDELLECLKRIVKYEGEEIEVVVQDDCSTQNILEIVSGLKDNRVRYFVNENNLGQDGAILNGIDNCIGEFVFLLRTHDYIISDAIPDLLDTIDKKNIVFLTGSCVDESGFPYMLYEDNTIYKMGVDTLYIHEKLYNHPSGFAFRREAVDTDYIRRYQGSFIDPKMSVITCIREC